MTARLFSRSETEWTIAVARIALAASGLVAVWLESPLAARTGAIVVLHASYLGYAIALAIAVWRRFSFGALPLTTHLADIALFAVFQNLALNPSSPFVVYFVFSLFSGALRWQWRGTIGTALLVFPSYFVVKALMGPAVTQPAFEGNTFVVRMVYITATSVLLVYLGQHEARLRGEIQRLARWPSMAGPDPEGGLTHMLHHAADLIGSRHALVTWEALDEPWLRLASWPVKGPTISKHPPGELDPVVPPPLADSTILAPGRLSNSGVSLISREGVTWEWHGLPLHSGLIPHLSGLGLTSAAFRTDTIAGRVFFTDLGTPATELMSLTEVVAREVGTSIGQLHATERARELAASEQRISLARDLHDGVLQSMTGIRLELAAVAATLDEHPSDQVRDRLLSIERAIAMEQRELRFFIDDLRPTTAWNEDSGGLTARLRAMRERLQVEWKTPITITVRPSSMRLSEPMARAVLHMTHEATINALKHAHASRVSAEVSLEADALRINVRDDGRGFAFKGRYDHAALGAAKLGPISLRERADALGGKITIESTETGSRVEITLRASAVAS